MRLIRVRIVAGVVLWHFFLITGCAAQTIPNTLWGKWVVRRELPTTTISCWGERESHKIIGTELEYSDKIFRWNSIVTNNPATETRVITAEEFHSENSGGSANGSQVTFRQLGIRGAQATQISIHHIDANVTGATIEIPGDKVLVKDRKTIVFSVCNTYFEAVQLPTKEQASPK